MSYCVNHPIPARSVTHIGNRTRQENEAMISTMERSSGDKLGFVVSGNVTKADYQTLVPAVEAAIEEFGSVSLVLDLNDFHWEKVSAWGADMEFGKEHHDKIVKMAIVGHKKWQKHLAHLCEPYYAREARYFESDADAWDWLND